MRYIEEFRNKDILKKLASEIARVSDKSKTYNFMEVCGTHTMSIFKFGLKELLPPNIRLISGPGCPVCVTPVESIDKVLSYSQLKDSIIATFGDMIRVPGSKESLDDLSAKGANVKIIYSPEEALGIAESNPEKKVILIGIGFETTAPLFASAILKAKKKKIDNFSVLSLHKTLPEALQALLIDEEIKVDGFMLPGHVSAIIGSKPYKFIPKIFGVRCVICGFEPLDIIEGVLNLIEQKAPRVEIQYKRVVREEGNRFARDIMYKVFEKCDSNWRGLGTIKNSGLRIRKEFKQFDAERNFKPRTENLEPITESSKLPGKCLCGDVLKGKKEPTDCVLFGKACTPVKPIGACMVSSEGTCAAWYKYIRTM